MSDSNRSSDGFATRAIHLGYDPHDYHGALIPPVFMTSTYAFEDTAQGQRRFLGEEPGYIYSRVGNPTVSILEARLASLEGGEAALATSSGMGAITSALWTLLKAGDILVADRTLYGCTYGFFQHGLARLGVTIRFVDCTDLDALERALSGNVRAVFFETPANPNMRLIDIVAVAALTRRHGALSIVDNTYCTPYLQRPIELGADLVVHSATKYLGGHGDLIAGAVVGRKELIDEMRFFRRQGNDRRQHLGHGCLPGPARPEDPGTAHGTALCQRHDPGQHAGNPSRRGSDPLSEPG